MPDRLERAYRRLLLAYPRWYRERRGTEILTTLLDAARPGQRRPHAKDAINLIAGGLRCRLTPPSWRTGLVALSVAALFGLELSGAALAWLWSRPSVMPAPGAAAEIVPLAPQTHGFFTSEFPTVRLPLPASEGWSGPAPAAGYVKRTYRPGAATEATVVALHRDLPAQGWRVGELTTSGAGRLFWAGKGDTVIRVHGFGFAGAQPTLAVQVHRTAPNVLAPTVAALLLGCLIAWTLACAVLHRAATRRPVVSL